MVLSAGTVIRHKQGGTEIEQGVLSTLRAAALERSQHERHELARRTEMLLGNLPLDLLVFLRTVIFALPPVR